MLSNVRWCFKNIVLKWGLYQHHGPWSSVWLWGKQLFRPHLKIFGLHTIVYHLNHKFWHNFLLKNFPCGQRMTVRFLTSSCVNPNAETLWEENWIHAVKMFFMVSILENWIMRQCICNNIYCWDCTLRFSLFKYPIIDGIFQVWVFSWTAQPDRTIMWITTHGQLRLLLLVNCFWIWAGCTANEPSENCLPVPRILPILQEWFMTPIFFLKRALKSLFPTIWVNVNLCRQDKRNGHFAEACWNR